MIAHVSRRRALRVVLVAVCTSLLAAFDCGAGGEWTPDPLCPSWDSDCDNISDATETNGANSHHGFQVGTRDADPSIAKGLPYSSGSLVGGINLVNNGTGYYHYLGSDAFDYDDWGTLTLVNTIEAVGRAWWTGQGRGTDPQSCWVEADAPVYGSGDMSKRDGGEWFPDHPSSHQNGLDVDVRYLRLDNMSGENAWLDISLNPEAWDTLTSMDLLDCFLYYTDDRVQDIFISPILYDLLALPRDARMSWLSGHDNHFHVRIYDPDGTGN